MHTFTEENYLKAIYHLSMDNAEQVNTNALADHLATKAASVTDMLKKLADKKLIHYQRYQGVTLSDTGRSAAVNIIRKHRLWEVFLVEKLGLKWDEVHEIAEELEHIDSEVLIEKLDEFLGFPSSDPHGDPIPDKLGRFKKQKTIPLTKLEAGAEGKVCGVSEHSASFLQYLERIGLVLGKSIRVLEILPFDGSVSIDLSGKEITISRESAKHILLSI